MQKRKRMWRHGKLFPELGLYEKSQPRTQALARLVYPELRTLLITKEPGYEAGEIELTQS